MDGLGSFLTEAWDVISSNTFLAAAGVIATVVIGVMGIWLEERARRARHKADPSIAASGFMGDIKARVEGRFLDAVDLDKVFDSYSYYLAAPKMAEAFEAWFKAYRAKPSRVEAPAGLTTHQAYVHWWRSRSQYGFSEDTILEDGFIIDGLSEEGFSKDEFKDFKLFNVAGAVLEDKGYRVGPPISPEEFAKLVDGDAEMSRYGATELRSMRSDYEPASGED